MIGQAKEPFGLEEQTSSKHLTFIEQSMATSAFAPGCHSGLGLSGHRSSFTWAIGVYEAADREKERDTYALTGRLTFTPWNDKNHALHIGIAGSGRDFGGKAYAIEERAEVHTAEKVVRSIEIMADDVRLLGLEFAWVKGPFSVQAEYMTTALKAATGKDAAYAGYYFQGSYFLTGESRPYKTGTFKGIKPINPYGALELVSRYSFLDVEDHKRGVSAANLTVGVNYYLNERIRLMTNYIKTNLTDGVSGEKGNAEAISFRMQYSI
jgi:phosphate-selective porin OprO/OprP